MNLTQLIEQYGWFFGIPIAFLLVVWYVFRPQRRKRYERDARIPFEEDRTPPKS